MFFLSLHYSRPLSRDSKSEILSFLTGYCCSMMISSIDFEYAGAKVIRFPGICKETAGADQNLICNCLTDRDIGSQGDKSLVSMDSTPPQPPLILEGEFLPPQVILVVKEPSLYDKFFNYPTLPTLSLSIRELRTRYPTLEATLTPTLEKLSTTFAVQSLFFQFTKELVRYSLSNFR